MMGFPNNWMPLSFGTSPENQSNAESCPLWHVYHPPERRLLNFILELKIPCSLLIRKLCQAKRLLYCWSVI
jgi:hypothetical protein